MKSPAFSALKLLAVENTIIMKNAFLIALVHGRKPIMMHSLLRLELSRGPGSSFTLENSRRRVYYPFAENLRSSRGAIRGGVEMSHAE